MLYGNIIFIKKTGGDGSKYPVSEKNVKIGRSEKCLIRIYNTQVALEHCQLIIGENGQATLKDLSNQTVLNGNILAHEEATLCHGDVFKVGERLARWEYLPTSKYYKQLLSPTGRLVAVVMPQQRCLEDQPSGTSASFVSGLKNSTVGGKRRYSERFTSETISAVKMRKSSSSNLNRKSKGDLSKFLTGRHSLKTKKLLLPLPKMSVRKSTSGSITSRTPKGKSRKSTLPSWKTNTVSPGTTKLTEQETSLSIKSHGKSAESCSSRNKSLLNNTLDQESEKLSVGKKRIRSPQKTTTTSEKIFKSKTEIILKTPVKVSMDSPFKIIGSTESTKIVNKSPEKQSLTSTPSSKPVRLIYSEKKQKYNIGKSSVPTRESKRLSLILSSIDKNKRNKKMPESFSGEELKSLRWTRGIVSDLNVQSMLKYNKKGFLNEKEWSPLKMKTPASVDIFQTSPNELDDVVDSKKGKVLQSQNKSVATRSTPLKKMPKKLEKSIRKLKPSSSQKNLSKSPSQSSTSAANSASARSPKSSSVRISLRKTINLSKERISTPRGVRRKLSPSISSAERAAKKLKTSSPKKPDKNKKAALLVLGKANRKQLLAQNVKVLLKQKIVKKAIKQSTTAGADKTDNGKKRPFTDVKGKPKNGFQKKTSEAKKKVKKNDSSKGNTPENSSNSAEVPPQIKDEIGYISKGENALEENMLNNSKGPETTLRSPSKFKNLFNEVPGKALSNQYRKSESPRLSHYKETSSPYGNFEKATENFLFNSNRRCSKRLSSKNDLGRPDFVELSPTALGLIPKNIEAFKFPMQNKRRSSSLVTPKVVQSIGIIKSASTSKIGNRRNVRFSSKDISLNSEFCSPSEKTDFDFGTFQTPDVSVDVFISPLGDKTSGSKKGLNESSKIIFTSEDNSEVALTCRSNSEPRKCIRKLLQSPQPKKRVSYNRKEVLRDSRSSTGKVLKLSTDSGKSERDLSSFGLELYTTPQNNLSNMSRSSKNDSRDVKKVKKLLTSPRNDLSDVRGVKKLLATPKVQKSPKNDLSDVRGVKKLLATPKVQKSPKNDLSDVRGVKKMLATPKVQKSPKNDLSDVRGVKKLLATPRVQKSPKNDLSDVRGVKKLLATPRVQKSPKNDLSDVRGVKKLLTTPRVQKSPKNNLTEVAGVRELFRSPRIQKSPKNELLDLSGIQQLLDSPRQRTSKNYSSESKKESLFEFLERNLIKSSKNQKLSKDSMGDLKGFSESGKLDRDAVGDILNVDCVEQALEIGKSVRKNQKIVSRKSLADGFRAVKEGRSTYATSQEPKNDLSDVMGVRELFIRHKSGRDFNESLMGVSELSSLPEEDVVSTLKRKTSGTKSKTQAVEKVTTVVRPKRGMAEKYEYIKTRRSTRGILRKASAEETTRRSVRVKKLKIESGLTTESIERKPTKRKAAEGTKAKQASKSPAIVKRSERLKNGTKRSERTAQMITKAEPERSGVTKTRKRKHAEEDTASPLPKLRRKRIAESVKKTPLMSSEKNSFKNVRKASEKVKNEMSKSSSKVQSKTSKTNVERSLKVQKNRSQRSSKKNLADSEENLSPIKTRSAKKEAASRRNRVGKQRAPPGNKVSESAAGRKNVIPVVRKSTRRK